MRGLPSGSSMPPTTTTWLQVGLIAEPQNALTETEVLAISLGH